MRLTTSSEVISGLYAELSRLGSFSTAGSFGLISMDTFDPHLGHILCHVMSVPSVFPGRRNIVFGRHIFLGSKKRKEIGDLEFPLASFTAAETQNVPEVQSFLREEGERIIDLSLRPRQLRLSLTVFSLDGNVVHQTGLVRPSSRESRRVLLEGES